MLFFLKFHLYFADFFSIFDYMLLFQENFSLINSVEEISVLNDSSCDESAPTVKMRVEGLILFISVVFLYYAVCLGPSYINILSINNTDQADVCSNNSNKGLSDSLRSIDSFSEFEKYEPKIDPFKPRVHRGGLIRDETLDN